jgi:hypothetical protein
VILLTFLGDTLAHFSFHSAVTFELETFVPRSEKQILRLVV